MTEPKISVVIPVYNVEKYITQCVESILRQDYSSVEILLVDDGSKDASPELCDRLAEKCTDIKVFHISNGGASAARNIGLSHATGEYVYFMDSDDFWGSDVTMLARLMERLVKAGDKADFLMFNFDYYYQEDDQYRPAPLYQETVLAAGSKEERVIQLIKSGLFPMMAWNKIIKKEVLLKNHIRFQEGTVAEDIPWFIELLESSLDFVVVNERLITYRKQVAGAVTRTFSEKKYTDLWRIIKEGAGEWRKRSGLSELRAAMLSFFAYEYSILLGMTRGFDKKNFKRYIRELKEYRWLLRYTMNPKVKKVSLLVRLVGFSLSSRVLKKYMKAVVNK